MVPDVNPAHPEEAVAEVGYADASVAGETAAAASAAFDGWRHTPAPARGEILRRGADILWKLQEATTRDFVREEGKTMPEASGEIDRAVAILRYYAGQTLEPEGDVYPSHDPRTLLYAHREPLGVVAAITPFNFPVAIPAWKIAPALAYGNTVVWKPAEQVPLTSVHLLTALLDAGLPTGMLNLVLGTGEAVGAPLISHPAVDAITFTGPTAVGKRIQAVAVEHGKKVQMEMGGENPAIVLADADLDFAVEQVARAAFLSAGQKCTATSRVIVETPMAGEFAAPLSEVARTWMLGDPLDPRTRVGPVVSDEQMDKVLVYLQIAHDEGAEVVAGGERARDLGSGYFVRPTVLQGLASSSRVVREEIFGPVVAVLPADSYDEALANDTAYGLSASLFTNNLTRALDFARECRVGVVKVNQESAGLEFQVPFGGMKESSSGSREQGKVARDFLTPWKTVYIDALSGA